MSAVATALLLAGGALLVLAAWGVIRLPDALSRQHAATKAGTLAVAMVCLGAMFQAGATGWTLRLLAILGCLLATLPSTRPFAFARTRASQRRAQANSRPRMARPAGITTRAGPGSTTMASPISSSVPPISVTAMRRARR